MAAAAGHAACVTASAWGCLALRLQPDWDSRTPSRSLRAYRLRGPEPADGETGWARAACGPPGSSRASRVTVSPRRLEARQPIQGPSQELLRELLQPQGASGSMGL